MPIDNLTFRRTLGSFASGITVITTQDPATGALIGITVSAFSSVSMEPPLVLFCLDNRSPAIPIIQANGHFGVNILASNQSNLSNNFAAKSDDKWQGIEYTSGVGNVPMLDGTIANLQCSVRQVVDGGDHRIFIGLVEHAQSNPGIDPLVYCRGRYSEIVSSPC